MLKGKPPIKKKPSSKSSDVLTKKALATIDANIARIDAQERGEKSTKVDAKAPTKRGKQSKTPKSKRMSGLDAAAKVLVESKDPLGAHDIVKAMAQKGYWKSPGGQTPHATIHAAICREISENGKASRFRKVDRGLFATNK